MYVKVLTPAQDAIKKRISERTEKYNFQDYSDYSDSSYLDASSW